MLETEANNRKKDSENRWEKMAEDEVWYMFHCKLVYEVHTIMYSLKINKWNIETLIKQKNRANYGASAYRANVSCFPPKILQCLKSNKQLNIEKYFKLISILLVARF
jgi:hypothetical protein